MKGRSRIPSHQNPYPWLSAISSERDPLAPNFSQGRERVGLCIQYLNFFKRTPHRTGFLELASLGPLIGLTQSSFLRENRETVAWVGRLHNSSLCSVRMKELEISSLSFPLGEKKKVIIYIGGPNFPGDAQRNGIWLTHLRVRMDPVQSGCLEENKDSGFN